MGVVATSPADILRFLLSCADEGARTALVTLADVIGTAPRAVGAQMAVAEDGRFIGSFSGGCIEAAVVSEAIDAIITSRIKLVRYGVGSPYLDIRLPCGGGIDLLFSPDPDCGAVKEVVTRLERRGFGALWLPGDGTQLAAATAGAAQSRWRNGGFEIVYLPNLRLVAIGQGDEPLALAHLAHVYGADVSLVSPAPQVAVELTRCGIDMIPLITRNALPPIQTDPWTAIVFLFHDRDWEEVLLPRALSLPSFYIGAVGSRRTHTVRLESLRDAGVPEHLCQKLASPVGLIPSTRDPATLSLSILSQIVGEYNRSCIGSKIEP